MQAKLEASTSAVAEEADRGCCKKKKGRSRKDEGIR
jgi:hypothetical protein